MLDKALVAHGSPTLARLKLGSLFTVSCAGGNFDGELAQLNAILGPKGLVLTKLRERSGRALMYVYRTSELERSLACPMVQGFLKECGYDSFELEAVLSHLRKRLTASEEFPHEIGVFLGYPLADVIGFIQNEGRDCLCCGCWKVYSNECEALRTFARLRKCKEVYGRLFAQGCPLSQLTMRSRTA